MSLSVRAARTPNQKTGVMAEIAIEQALYRRTGEEPPTLLARSPGFCDDWLPEAEHLLTAFGDRPPGVACPSAVFAHPLGKDQVAVVHVADRPAEGTQLVPLGFHVLVLARDAYTRFLGDPFLLIERLPPAWEARSLPALTWPAEPLPRRTVHEVQGVLKRLKSGALREDEEVNEEEVERTAENSEGPALLGGVQLLIDGGKLVFERPGPDTRLLHGLWTLLPTSTRSRLWPASFAFSNELHFDTLVVRRARRDDFPGYTTEEQAADYPEGRYELRLQTAAEAGDQAELDALLSRRSWGEMWRLGVTLLVMFVGLAVASRLLLPSRPVATEARGRQAAIVTGVVGAADPLRTLTTYMAAREMLKELEEVAR
jgi:hypothetical protein